MKGYILSHIALDLFSGHGWGVAMEKLGVKEYSVDIMPAVRATRLQNNMSDITYENVWDVHLAEKLSFNTLIASPACQTFSMAGNGSGRKALLDVVALINNHSYEDMDYLRSQGEALGDERTALVLAPLHYAWKFRPEYIVLEQVPTVQPVWEAYAEVLKTWGYGVWTGILRSEQYGVAQTRKRSILVAAKNKPMTEPVPTHSKFNNRFPDVLDEGVQKWVSMHDVLGDLPIGQDTAKYLKLHKQKNQAVRSVNQPAPTLAFGNDYMSPRWFVSYEDAKAWAPNPDPVIAQRVGLFPIEQAAQLQSYPAGFTFAGNKMLQFKQVANSVPPAMAEEVLKHLWSM